MKKWLLRKKPELNLRINYELISYFMIPYQLDFYILKDIEIKTSLISTSNNLS